MSEVNPAPIYQPLIEDMKNPVASIPWILFFNKLSVGDTGTDWTPHFVSLGVTGAAPTITGRVYKLSQSIAYFALNIVPGTDTTATAGTTYIDNFPLTMSADGINFAVSGLLGTNSGMCDRATNRIYVPGWSAVTVPLTVVGLVEAQ